MWLAALIAFPRTDIKPTKNAALFINASLKTEVEPRIYLSRCRYSDDASAVSSFGQRTNRRFGFGFIERSKLCSCPLCASAGGRRTDGRRTDDGRRFLPHQSRRRLHLHHEMLRGTRRDGRERSLLFLLSACQPSSNRRIANPLCRPRPSARVPRPSDVRPSNRSIFERCILISSSRSRTNSSARSPPSF